MDVLSLWGQSHGGGPAGMGVTEAPIQSPFQKLQFLEPLEGVDRVLFCPIHPWVLPLWFLQE